MKLKLGILLTILLLLVVLFIYNSQRAKQNTFPQSPSQTNTPTQTSTPTVAPEAQNQNPAHPLLILKYPQENQTTTSPMKIVGEARGQWFFEATFPVVLTNWDGLIIAEGFATAQGNWMTEEFVPFTAELSFTPDITVSNRGSLILQKSNPSGLPENDDAYEITVFFE